MVLDSNSREAERLAFIGSIPDWRDAAVEALPSDASFRRYFRLRKKNNVPASQLGQSLQASQSGQASHSGQSGQLQLEGLAAQSLALGQSGAGDTAMIMDAAPPRENIRPFITIDERLVNAGYSAPLIFARDIERGFLLLEDFGQATFTKLLATAADIESCERELYHLAIQVLIEQHRQPGLQTRLCEDLPVYNWSLYHQELHLFCDWYLPIQRQEKLPSTALLEFDGIWQELLNRLSNRPAVFVFRDFHVDNLMILPRKGMAQVGLLDFQDGVQGPPLYDLVSLLRDARRQVSPEIVDELCQVYIHAMAYDLDDFYQDFVILSLQRNLKILGIFVRLAKRDDKPVYLKHIEHLWRMVELDCRHPIAKPFADWLFKYCPPSLRCAPSLHCVPGASQLASPLP